MLSSLQLPMSLAKSAAIMSVLVVGVLAVSSRASTITISAGSFELNIDSDACTASLSMAPSALGVVPRRRDETVVGEAVPFVQLYNKCVFHCTRFDGLTRPACSSPPFWFHFSVPRSITARTNSWLHHAASTCMCIGQQSV